MFFREVLAKSIEKSGLTTLDVAYQMSKLLNKEISKSLVDSWLKESGPKFPMVYLLFFCQVVQNTDVLKYIVESSNLVFLDQKQALQLELIKIKFEKAKLDLEESFYKEVLKILKSNSSKD